LHIFKELAEKGAIEVIDSCTMKQHETFGKYKLFYSFRHEGNTDGDHQKHNA